MKKFRRLGLDTAGWKTLAGLFARGAKAERPSKPSRAARLAAMAGSDGHTLDQLEQRQLLFTLTVTPDLVDPATGLGTVVSPPFAYHLPTYFSPIPDPQTQQEGLTENFDDEMAQWTQNVPPAPPSGTTFMESNIGLTYRGPTPNPVILGRRGANGQDQFLRLNLNGADQATFTFFNQAQGTGNRTQRLALSSSFTIENGPDGDPLKTDANGSRIELLLNAQVVATFTGAQLAALATPVVGGTRYDINFAQGFDAVRFSSAANAPSNATYADSFNITLITAQFPSTRFASAVDGRVFGAIVNFTAPAGATVQFLDLYGRDMVLTLTGRTPQGAQLPDIDRNGDGIPDYNDGIGQIIIRGANTQSSFILTGGSIAQVQGNLNPVRDIVGDGGWKLVIPSNPTGTLQEFQQAGLGFAISESGQGVVGLPPGPGSIVVGSPFVRDRSNSDNYYGLEPAINPQSANRTDQGVFVTGSIGQVRVDGIVFGSSQISGAVARLAFSHLYGSLRVEGDAGQIFIASEAGAWFNPDDEDVVPSQANPVQRTGSRLFIGRTAREVSIGGRNSMDIEVLGDVNNPNRAALNFRDFRTAEVIYNRDDFPNATQDAAALTIRQSIFRTDWSGEFGGEPSGVLLGDTWLRNDFIQAAEFVGYNGTSARVFGALGGLDGVSTGVDRTDVYAFPASPDREVVISAVNIAGLQGLARAFTTPYARIVDRDGRVIAAVDGGDPGRGPGGNRGGTQVMRFRPERADTYYLVLDGGTNQADYGVQIDGMAPVTFGLLRVGAAAGAVRQGTFIPASAAQAVGGFTLNVSSGSMGQIRAGTGYVTGAGGISDANSVTNNNQPDKIFYSLGGATINVASNLYSVFVGADIRGTQIAVGGDLGTITTGQGPAPGVSINNGDLFAADIRVGGRIALLDVSGTIGADQVTGPDNRGGSVVIQTGRGVNRRGDIGQILVGAYLVGPATTILTNSGSTIDQLRVGVNGRGAGSDFPGWITDSQPTIRMGAGSDIRFVDFELIQRPGDANVQTNLVYGQTILFTDDAGARFTITINGGFTLADGTQPFLGSNASITVLPIDGSQGVAVSRITANLLGGANLVISGDSAGVVSLGNIFINSPNDQSGQSPATPIVNSSVLFTGSIAEIDVGTITQTAGVLTTIQNSTPNGDIVAIDAQAVQNIILTGSLGRTQVNSGWASNLLGPRLGIGARAQSGAAGGTLGVSGNAVNEWSGGSYYPVPAPAFANPAPLEAIGSPIDDTLNGVVVRSGDLRLVQVNGQVGDVLVEGGDVISVIANFDTVRAQGVFEGIVGSIYALNVGTVDVGDGLAGAGPGPFAQAGIFADGNIFDVRATRYSGAVLSGVILAAGTLGVTNSVGAGALRTYRDFTQGILDVTVTDGLIDGSYIAGSFLDDWWNSIIVNDQNIIGGAVRQITGTRTDMFRSFVGGFLVGNITLNQGAYDAVQINSTSSVGTITAREFRNSTRLGAQGEFYASRISTTTNLAGLATNDSSGDIADLNLDIGGSVTGTVQARNILRSAFDVNLVINEISATQDIRTLSVNAGSLRRIIAGQNIRSTTLTIAGPIETVQATAGEITQLDIDSAGPDGRLDSLTAPGRIQGRINSSGSIGTIRSTNGDVQADITTRQEPGRAVPGLTLLQAGGSFIGALTILGDVGTIRVGRNIAQIGLLNPVLDLRSNVGTIEVLGGQIYTDVLVGQNITGSVMIGRVSALPGNDLVSTNDIVAFGRIAQISIMGDFAGDIVSRSGGIGSIVFTNGSLRPTGNIIVSDGSLGTLTFNGGDLLGDVLVDGDIGTIDVLVGADGFKGQIGVASFRRDFRAVPGDPLRNELPPGVQPTSGVDGVLIRAGGSITRINVARGSIWESRIIAGTFIDSINVALQFRNDAFTTGNNNQVVAGDRIGTVTVGGFAGAVGIVAGVRSLGADLSLGGTGDNADTVGVGTINSVLFNGPRVVNSFVSAGISPDSSGFYNTTTSKSAGGRSVVSNVFARRAVNTSAFSDGTLGTTSAGIVRGGSNLAPVDTSKVVNTGSPSESVITPGVVFSNTTALGQNFSLTFSGPGQAFFRKVGTTTRIRLVNTTSASSLVINAPGNGPLGNFTVVGNTGAGLGTLTVNAAVQGNSTLYLDAGITTAIFAGRVGTTGTIGSGGTISSLTFASVNRARVEAAVLTSLIVNGDFGSATTPASLVAFRLDTVNITGTLFGSVSSDQRINSFTAGAIRGGGVRSGDSIQTVTVGSLFQARISARNSLPSVTVNGDATESGIYAGADLGTDADFGGTGTAADTVTNGTIGTVRINGNFRRSDIGAGVLPGASGFLGNSDTQTAAGRSSIASVIITGTQVGSLVNSEQYRIMSTGTVGTVTVGGLPFTSLNNFRTQTVAAVAIPVRVNNLRVIEDSRVYTAIISFNQQIDISLLSSALSVTELRSGGSLQVTLAEGTDYTVRYDSTRNEARVQFARAVTARSLPQQPGVPGPGVYQFRLNASILRGSTQDTLLDGNRDGSAGDDWVQNTIVGDAGDKVTAGNPASNPTIDFYSAADLDLVLRTNALVGSLAQVNTFYSINGSIGDHPDTDPDRFRSGGDADVYRVSLRAGQILRMSELRGVAQQASRGVFDSAGNLLGGTFGTTAQVGIPGTDSGAQVIGNTPGLRRLPNAVNTDVALTSEDQYLVTVTGTYFIVIASNFNQVNIADTNAIANLDPVPGAFGAYSFDIMVFDDQNSGFLGDTASGTGAAIAYAPTPSQFFGPDGIEGTSDDIRTFVVGDWSFVIRDVTVNGVTSRSVVGSNSQGWTSTRLPAPNGTFGTPNDRLSVNINSSIGLPNTFGRPVEVAPDVDIYRLNNGQPIAPGSKIRATLRLSANGADIGVGPEQLARTSQAGSRIVPQQLFTDVQFALFELPAGTGFENARLVGAPSDFLPIGGTPSANPTTDSRTTYGYDASGDFFMEFVIPGAQTISSDVPSSYALYLQGAIRSDYVLEIVQQGIGSTIPTKQNVLVETLGGLIGWLEVGANTRTTLDPFNVSTLGLSGQIDGVDVSDYVLNNVIANLNNIFTAANSNVIISTRAADFARQDYSTVFLAGNVEPNAFFNNGTFGVSQHRDFFNADKNDQAVVFMPSLGALGITATRAGTDTLVQALTASVARRIGELVGLSLETSAGASLTSFPVMAFDSPSRTPGSGGSYVFNSSDRALARAGDATTTTVWYLGSQNAAGLLGKLVARRV